MAKPDLTALYRQMARIRVCEEVSGDLWRRGFVAGELHSGIGEEAVAAGVVGHLRDGDGLVADHRSTPPLVVRGVEPRAILLELVGSEEGLCRGHGGHMHLMDSELRVASDGIVGASAPLACGFALESRLAGRGGVAVAFFGEGAANQGMLLESLNLAQVWRLPVVFVCKDSALAITTRRSEAIAGDLVRRARGFGLAATRVSGRDVRAVWHAADRAIRRARAGRGPSFLLVRVHRPQGHFLGDPLLRAVQDPIGQTRELAPALVRSLRARSGARSPQRLAAIGRVGAAISAATRERALAHLDPLKRTRRLIPTETATQIDSEARDEIDRARDAALAAIGVDGA